MTTWARRLVRRGWRSTLVLGLLAGLAAGCALTAWGAARRTAGAFDRAEAKADMPALNITFCPPDLEVVDADTIGACFGYLPFDEVAVIRSLPEVETAMVGMFRGVTIAHPDHPDDTLVTASFDIDSPDLHASDGQHLLLAGRWHRDGATDEVVLSEAMADKGGFSVGDEVLVTAWSADELGSAPADGAQLHGPQRLARVVGVSRGLLDLNAGTADQSGSDLRIFSGLGDPSSPGFAPGFHAALVRARDGVSPDVLKTAIARALPDAKYQAAPATGASELAPIRDAIDYEARGTLALAALLALAAAVFAAQAMARQSRREWADLPTLRALGLTGRQARLIAALRGAVTGAVAGATAAAVAVLASPLGPVGVARRSEVVHPIRLDLVVVGIGGLATVLVVTAATAVALPAPARGRNRLAGDGLVAGPRLSPVVAAGVGMTRRTAARGMPLGAALSGVALAAATVVAGSGLVTSLDGLHSHPARYGAPWDIAIAAMGGPDMGSSPVAAAVGELPVDAAAGIVGADVSLESERGRVTAWVQAFEPAEGFDRTVAAPIIEGRPPATADEVALGTITMSDLHVEIGDVVELRSLATVGTTRRVTVVGTTIVNDMYETSPGRGGVVIPDLLHTVAPESTPDPYVLQLLPGSDVDAALARLQELEPGAASRPVPQAAVLNVDRLRDLPYLLAAVVAALAVASLAHALVLSVRRHRRPLAVLKSIGFTHRQVRRVVATHATLLVAIALAVGVPLGVVAGRWGWRFIARQLGVVDVASVPVLVVLATVAGVLAVANLVALAPGWRAARTNTATALRTE